MPDFDAKHLNDTLTALRSDIDRVPLADAADVRHRGDVRTRRSAAAVGLAAAACLVIAGVSIGGLGEGEKRAVEPPPAAATSLPQEALLIPDELPAWGPFAWRTVATTQPSDVKLVKQCEQATAGALGPRDIWHRTFADRGLEAQQVAARFATAEQAQKAFGTITEQFDECNGDGPGYGWAPFSVSGGRVVQADFMRMVNADEGEFEFAAVAIHDRSITVFSFTMVGMDANFVTDPLETTMRFAVQRLAGERDVTKNAVPESFRFAEERTNPAWQKEDVVNRIPSLGHPWMASPCATSDVPEHVLESDALRTGMLTVQLVGDGEYGFRQLGLYADAATARAVAEDLRSAFTRCATKVDGPVRTTWTTEPGSSGNGVSIHWSRSENEPESGDSEDYSRFTSAIAIVNQGNAVFVADASAEEVAGPQSSAEAAVRAAADANTGPMCEVADCE